MAKVYPFKAIRPGKQYENVIPALPYDVYSREEAYEFVKNNPDSFLAIDRPETQFDKDFDMYSDECYQKAASLIKKWLEEGRFIREKKDLYYIYELTMNNRTQTGIVGCASINDYESGVIKRHENTRADKEKDRICHVETSKAQTGPIFLAYKSNDTINNIVDYIKKTGEPIYDVTFDDGIRHRIWGISEENDIISIGECFENTANLYIADGHHRCASAVKVGLMRRTGNHNHTGDEEYNRVLSVLFPDNELMIMDYNRVVKDLGSYNEKTFVDKLIKYFMVGTPSFKPIKPSKKGEISMFIDDLWYPLTIKEAYKSDDPVEGLDVSILQKYVMDELLGIKDPRTDKRIDFIGGIRGLDELEKRVKTDCKVAFAMYPTSIQELFSVADAGLLMPPKSTWFEPKLRSGFFIHDIS